MTVKRWMKGIGCKMSFSGNQYLQTKNEAEYIRPNLSCSIL